MSAACCGGGSSSHPPSLIQTEERGKKQHLHFVSTNPDLGGYLVNTSWVLGGHLASIFLALSLYPDPWPQGCAIC
eukprot:365108-Chlamydomonas_euryale.AAC.10